MVSTSNLILKGKKIAQLTIACLGSIIGLFVLIATIQLYLVYTSDVFGGEDMLKEGMMIQKKVNTSNTITGINAKFSKKDIEELESAGFVDDYAPVKSTLFKVNLSLDENLNKEMAKFSLLYYLECLPDRFLDAKNEKFIWKEGDKTIPIILPSNMLTMFNSGFAASQGIPQLSEETLSQFSINIDVFGNGKEQRFKGQIVGFTGSLNSLLVPETFIDWSNSVYADKNKEPEITSIYTVANSKQHGEFVSLLKERGYEVNDSKLKTSEEKAKLQIIISILLGLGIIILTLSALSFVQYSQLIILKSEYEIGVLTNIGYNYKYLAKHYIKFFGVIFICISIIAFIAAIIGKYWFNGWVLKKGIVVEGGLSGITYLIGIGFLVIYLLVNSYVIYSSIKKIAIKN